MEETKWVVQINEELKSDGASVPEKEQWKRHWIYKIPSRVTALKDMEDHKHRALIHFL